ncbi:transporter substrate-binding domain-containing protein [Paracoccus thiocyanatus]|nr:transporter substrate-binding domain-containing protein [Paracoccus thiocyanatus]
MVPVGLMFSCQGPYGALGRAMLDGAMLAVEEVNADPDQTVELQPRFVEAAGQNDRYVAAAQDFLGRQGLKHVVGCYTSSSRKEVLPVFEKYDALLWYPSHYEGFETSENVVYTGASPNQHVVPLAHFMLRQGYRRCLLLGSNYIWAWENHRIMRDILARNGGAVLAERYLPVGETRVGEMVELALKMRPDFIYSTFIGDSAYCFLRMLRARCTELGIDQPREMPVTSCSLAESELNQIGPEACGGHLSSSVYFSSIDTQRNRDWVAAWNRRYPGNGPSSADAEASYIAIHILARAVRMAGDLRPDAVLSRLGDVRFDAPQGPVRVDPENRHTWLWPRIGRSRPDGSFDVVQAAARLVRPDPYLVWEPLDMDGAGPVAPYLQLVK